ncbi:MAG TPA: hypothetical protein VIN01_01360 [Candidatus Dormibacteraeota bacterium]
MLIVRRALLCLLPLLLLACGSPATASQAAPGPPVPTAAPADPSAAPAATEPPPSPSPATEATPIATPTPAPPPPPQPQPDFGYLRFTGLAAGNYPVHLHRICSGSQGYHLAYLPYLSVSSAGSGEIAVPAGYFGQGWCVVVYANRAQTSVAAYRPI